MQILKALLLCSLSILAVVATQKEETLGYVPESSPFDNPSILTDPTPTIPSAPDCTVRPQTVVEIQRMRESASRIAQMIEAEVQIMNKRKTYVEQMTAYLNDRIRELNKVKSELSEEARWIEVSTNRIDELAAREKLVKMQDILACLNSDSNKLTGESQIKTDAIKALQVQSKLVEDNIKVIKTKIDTANAGLPPGSPPPA